MQPNTQPIKSEKELLPTKIETQESSFEMIFNKLLKNINTKNMLGLTDSQITAVSQEANLRITTKGLDLVDQLGNTSEIQKIIDVSGKLQETNLSNEEKENIANQITENRAILQNKYSTLIKPLDEIINQNESMMHSTLMETVSNTSHLSEEQKKKIYLAQ